MSSYATKVKLKGATGINTSKLAAKSDLASSKAEIDKTDVDKLITASVDLNKLSNVVNSHIAKGTVYK